MKDLAKNSKMAAKGLAKIDHKLRKEILIDMADALSVSTQRIIEANQKDIEYAKSVNLNQAMIDRLILDENRIHNMVDGVKEIADQPDVVNTFFNEFTNEAGLQIKRQRIPLGVILMIFESRPNVVVDCAALAIKSSNAIILKGGKEAKNSNEILGNIIQDSISKYTSKDCVQVLASDDRSVINQLINLSDLINVVIPRGGEGLIRYIHENAKMPVIAHFEGLCHMYIDKAANLEKAVDLIINAKTQRTGVCNAIETLLIHRDIVSEFAPKITKKLKEKNTELRVDELFLNASNSQLKVAIEKDWSTEYLDNILSIKTVASIDEAIEHIDNYGTFHSESIISDDQEACNKFLNSIDASCVLVNASTRFNDGGQLGLGAELGISTSKIHAYGPMGAEQMTTTRFVVIGDGHIRS